MTSTGIIVCYFKKFFPRNFYPSFLFIDETARLQILKEIERLSNPVIMKQAKQFLLHYKQKNPTIYQDICLYSDVCKMLSETSFRLGPRRFIQDLFMEVNFTLFYTQNANILSRETKQIVISRTDENAKGAALRIHTILSLAMEERRQELFNKNVAQLNKTITHGFKIETTNVVEEITEDRLSPTKFEPRSPPLSSVKEENMSSTENLKKDDSNCKTDVTTATTSTTIAALSTIKTLDSLHLTYNENKFPIRNRNETNVIK